ncbi:MULTISPECIES: DUF262 domain-containing protein [unclassified Pseudomonas]|uniref:DUF262 domain-containing protein n=1 Tax=unclassified Pseudomonas TaxID=196821 RepID=UPI000C868E9A|nr:MULTISPECIES: DUF262 domain-containing protein [unclassified Pseudomonas]PMV25442.1 hypothetical protein C1X17_06915 [Pseudomonas sp. FW305-3-2-15-C-TSA2]PMV27917.1 hypothetical protein C1X22_16015 [Pseudomonas sp. DP16D-L5]PMV38407.1 hypothetical protein C1X21_15070 [Pseudomonas sp. FW305-3-2-15-A-LB2]PMV45100.1 hypothetical protein C1X16_14885 [Pseudomonas sp. FW305-3-2-15-C-R2A1]PMV49129.1 hypothetical protein C1X18_19265 [Pseudomonas sp. FW305-3-2-15-C-LB1]
MNQAVSEWPFVTRLSLDVEGIAVASTSLNNVFSGKRIPSSDGGVIFGRLHLPEYQRPYRWNEEQLGRLLDDLRCFFSSDAPDHDFYLGSIILHQEGGDGRQRGLLNIIDGQQRITSLALLHYLQYGQRGAPELKFNAPESHRRIQLNLRWLEQQRLPRIDFTRINVTLVVTRREDDAYRFFETQNTSGVRLGGADIVKAYHLRSVAAAVQDDFARTWESLGDLKPLVAAFMKSRHWQSLRWRDVASDRDPLLERKQIVTELAELTLPDNGDIAYRSLQVLRDAWGKETQTVQPGYAMRQPLGTGVNTMRVVTYFQGLRKTLLEVDKTAKEPTFAYYYKRLAHDACGSVFLSRAFDCALLMYASQFGTSRLLEASLWMFRMIFSYRLIKEVSVREDGVQAHLRHNPLLDWIASAHTHHELLSYLRDYTYTATAEHLDKNSIKKRFAESVGFTLSLQLPWPDPQRVAVEYDAQLRSAIERISRDDLACQGGK